MVVCYCATALPRVHSPMPAGVLALMVESHGGAEAHCASLAVAKPEGETRPCGTLVMLHLWQDVRDKVTELLALLLCIATPVTHDNAAIAQIHQAPVHLSMRWKRRSPASCHRTYGDNMLRWHLTTCPAKETA